jgi:hypothetical protein
MLGEPLLAEPAVTYSARLRQSVETMEKLLVS